MGLTVHTRLFLDLRAIFAWVLCACMWCLSSNLKFLFVFADGHIPEEVGHG